MRGNRFSEAGGCIKILAFLPRALLLRAHEDWCAQVGPPLDRN
jgi:hypothetical protein